MKTCALREKSVRTMLPIRFLCVKKTSEFHIYNLKVDLFKYESSTRIPCTDAAAAPGVKIQRKDNSVNVSTFLAFSVSNFVLDDFCDFKATVW